ncbi:hypothetical protein [Nocardia sp. BMG111209]|uniref:hypothetical protein n=1 Tax=Nocardia sp. BMG111209 TaxID=1160137 RepID=UPI000382C616|nr:hypothetical protein [Nocardia sp. BMG111209]
MKRIAVETMSMLLVALGAFLPVAACSTAPPSPHSAGPTTTTRYDPYVDDAAIVADYAKVDPGIFEKFNNYPNKSTGATRKFFDPNGRPDMDVIEHNMETFDEAELSLIPHDFYKRESDEKYAAHESSVAATHPPK